MARGPGTYDAELTAALASARLRGRIEGGILIVFGETPSSRGFACQATATILPSIPMMLRQVADQIEADQSGGMS
jgi:hypothetical protein